MKKLILFLSLTMVITITIYSQVPQAFKYQAIARDKAGNILTNCQIGIRITTMKGGADGTAVYVETQQVKSNSYGIINLVIGKGRVEKGDFAEINWGENSYFLNIEMDITGGTDYKEMGISQLYAVPYALYAEQAGSVIESGSGSGSSSGRRSSGGSSSGSNRNGLPNSKFPADGNSWLNALTGNVGIGTTSPTQLLSVYDGELVLQTDDNLEDQSILFQNTGGKYTWRIYRTDAGANHANLRIAGGFNDDYAALGDIMAFTYTGNVGIGTTAPVTGLHVDDTNGVLFTGTFGEGEIPIEGPGTRMMWYPAKAVFRAGFVDGTQWDDVNIGNHSIGMGQNSIASGENSVVLGGGTASGEYAFAGMGGTASGIHSISIGEGSDISGLNSIGIGYYSNTLMDNSLALGYMATCTYEGGTAVGYQAEAHGNASAFGNQAQATGFYSNAIGYYSMAYGDYATAIGVGGLASGDNSVVLGGGTATAEFAFSGMGGTASGIHSISIGDGGIASGEGATSIGSGNSAIGDYSTALGYYTDAESYVSVAMGRYNVGGGNPTSWVATDPLFEIGNGTSTSDSANALTVLKNGNVGIGTTSPTHILHVTGVARSTQEQWATSSDARVKENIHKIEGSLAFIEQLRPVSYNYTDEYIGDNQEMVGLQRGFIAQEVKEVLPEMVTTCTESVAGKTIEDFHLLNTSDLMPIMVSAMQQQQELIRKLERRIEELEGRLDDKR